MSGQAHTGFFVNLDSCLVCIDPNDFANEVLVADFYLDAV